MSFVVTDEILEKIVEIQRRVLAISKLAAEKDCGITISSMLSGSTNAVDVIVFLPGKPVAQACESYTWFYDDAGDRPYEGMCKFLDEWEQKINAPDEDESVGVYIEHGTAIWTEKVYECSRCSQEFMVDGRIPNWCPDCGRALDCDINGDYE